MPMPIDATKGLAMLSRYARQMASSTGVPWIITTHPHSDRTDGHPGTPAAMREDAASPHELAGVIARFTPDTDTEDDDDAP